MPRQKTNIKPHEVPFGTFCYPGDDWWGRAYKAHFPDIVGGMQGVPRANVKQAPEVDRILYMGNDTVIRVKEAGTYFVRGKAFFDNALPLEMGYHRVTRHLRSDEYDLLPQDGWINRPLICDYVAFGFQWIDRAYFLPCHTLLTAWYANRRQWSTQFPVIRHQPSRTVYNEQTKETEVYHEDEVRIFCAVTAPVVLRAMNAACTVPVPSLIDEMLQQAGEERFGSNYAPAPPPSAVLDFDIVGGGK